MPNWVTAKLTISGENSEKTLKQLLTEDEDGELRFDFNKILPMPKELEIVSGTSTDRAVELYLTSINPDIDYYGEHKVDKSVLENITTLANSVKTYTRYRNDVPRDEIKKHKEMFISSGLFNDEMIIEFGRKVVDNIMKYDAMDWYDWSIKNWNTKWNACHTVFDESTPNIVCFDTAWGDVRGLIKKLSEKFPTNTFEYAYSEEEIGIYTGVAEYKNGETLLDTEFKDNSKEAYEQAFDLWGDDLRERFKFDEKANTYKYIEDDEEDGGME